MRKNNLNAILVILSVLVMSLISVTSAQAIESFKAAAIQFNPILKDRDENIKKLGEAVEKAAKNGARLIVAPEMSTTGYQYASREEIAPYTDSIPGAATDKIGEIAKKYKVYVVFGMAERDVHTDLFYNAAAFVGPEGYIGKYRKSHQWEAEEHWSVWGDLGVPVFETQIGKVAINICMDATFFESARLAALGGADILAFPTNSTAQALWALQSRAVWNGLYIVAANRSNTELDYHMIGASAIWSPNGNLLASAKILPSKKEDINEANIIYAEIDPSGFKNAGKKRFADRRPELYKDIALHIAPWNYKATEKSKKITAAVVQYAPVLLNKNANKQKIKSLLSANQQKLDLIILPELTLSGNPLIKSHAESAAESSSGPTVGFYKELAKKYNCYVIGGVIVRKSDNKLYNTAVMIGADGKIVGECAKTHLSLKDETWATPGDKIGIFKTPEWRIGVMFGEDANYPEVAGVMGVKRVDVLAVLSSWKGEYGCSIDTNYKLSLNPYPDNAMCLYDAFALCTQAYTLVANFTGGDYKGGSGKYALDPLYGLDKVELAGNEEQAFVVSFDTLQKSWWFNQEKLVGGRNPHLYTPIISVVK